MNSRERERACKNYAALRDSRSYQIFAPFGTSKGLTLAVRSLSLSLSHLVVTCAVWWSLLHLHVRACHFLELPAQRAFANVHQRLRHFTFFCCPLRGIKKQNQKLKQYIFRVVRGSICTSRQLHAHTHSTVVGLNRRLLRILYTEIGKWPH